MAFMTPSERRLAEATLHYLKTDKVTNHSMSEMSDYLNAEFAVKPSAAQAIKYIEGKLYGKPIPEHTGCLRAAYSATQHLISTHWKDMPFDKILELIYAHPDCIAYYKSREGLWLMTMVVQNTVGMVLSKSKYESFDAAVADKSNGLADKLQSLEF